MLLNFEITFGSVYGDRESTYCYPTNTVTARDWELFSRLVLDKQFAYHTVTEGIIRINGKEELIRTVRVERDAKRVSQTIAEFELIFPGVNVFTCSVV
jgi:hypothetical protein